MLTRNWLPATLSISALLCSACGADEADEAEQIEIATGTSALVVDNGTSLNGTSLNGTSLNGTSLNGTSLNGTSLNGTSLVGAEIQAIGPGGELLEGADLVGAMLTGTRADGQAVALRVDQIVASPDPEIYLYTLSYQDGAQWKNVCGHYNGQPIPTIPLHGRWDESMGTSGGGDHIDDPGSVTFACVDSSLAKCVALGYKPWESVTECKASSGCQTIPLRALHQTCTRMLRADYCGDGMPHTLSRVPVNVWDNFHIQKRASVDDDEWRSEAEWTPEGAACVDRIRYDPQDATTSYILTHCPERLSAPFTCFSKSSTFASKYGFETPLLERSLLRVEFDYDYVLSRMGLNDGDGDEDEDEDGED